MANFTLNVVIPVPPRPPQDVVEEQFQKEYLIAIGIAAVVVSLLSIVVVILLAVKCRRSRMRRGRSAEESKLQLYQASASGSDYSSEASLRALQPSSKTNGSLVLIDPDQIAQIEAGALAAAGDGAATAASPGGRRSSAVDTGGGGGGGGSGFSGPDIISHTHIFSDRQAEGKLPPHKEKSGTQYKELCI